MRTLMVRGVPVQVSDEDFEWASRYRWRWGNGSPGKRYVLRGGGKRARLLHHAIWSRMGNTIPPGHDLDHKDRDRNNNQRENLRPLTRSANNANGTRKGYFWARQLKRWRVCVCKGGKKHYFGLFKTEEEAAAAYEAGKRELYPELYA